MQFHFQVNLQCTPKLPELIKYLKSLEATKSIFLVTNGQEPDMIQKLQDEDALPTQLYLSTNAADYESFIKINKPRYTMIHGKDGISTLDMLKNLEYTNSFENYID